MKKLRVTVEGKVYDVLVEMLDEGAPASAPRPAAPAAPPTPVAPAHVAAPAPAPAAAPVRAAGAGDIVSPLAGKVVSIDVKVGQAVEEGTQVVTIEAMKMNTYIFAPKAGVIAAILATPGDGVEEGTALIRMQ